jgi:2-polyprenyl-3-methyl-5-hydroxy-6-metoxy-1,4-benzoquinol methylase
MNCPLCNSENINKKFTIERFKEPFIIFECGRCKFQFQNTDKEKVYSFYSKNYYTGKQEYSYYDEREKEKFARCVWKKRFNILKKFDHSNGEKRFLDVGCAFGGFMQVAKEACYTPYGVEISDYAASFAAQRFGESNIFIGSIEDIKLPSNFFSIVTMVEVIEHIFDPKKALMNIFNSMKKGGCLLIQTANITGLQAKIYGKNYHYYLPGHVSYFSKKNLKNLLFETGFCRVKVIDGVEFGLLPKLLKSRGDFKKPLDYLKWIRISCYHIISRLGLTSSMVVIATK